MQKKLSVNPWLGIWTHPRVTIRAIIRYSSGYCLPLLYWIYGFPLLLQIFQNTYVGDEASLLTIMISGAIGGLVLGWIGINITSSLLYWTGKWVGGKGGYSGIRAAVSWSSSVSRVTLLIWIIQMIVFKETLFTSGFFQTAFTSSEMIFLGVSSLLQFVAGVWGCVIMLKTLAEVQQFSTWKALFNLLLMALVIMGACIVFSVIVPGLFY
ncbi:MAG: YIP1 family protein [Candidatus Rhabdochlamydia sp.]